MISSFVRARPLARAANTDTKLLIYALFQKGRVLAQDGDQHVVASFKSLYKNRIERCGHQGFSEFSLHCPNHAHGHEVRS